MFYIEGNIEKEKTLIGLYQPNTDPIKSMPVYYTKTDSSNFTINNLNDSQYEVYAFTDKNNNMMYDSLTESISFVKEVIDTKSTDTLKLINFKEEIRKFTFSRPTYKDKFVELEFTKGLKTINCELPYVYDQAKRKLFVYENDGIIKNFIFFL